MKPIHFLLALVILIGVGAFVFYRVQNRTLPVIDEYGAAQPPLPENRILSVNGKDIRVEVARTEDEQRRGLSFRPSLGADEGMYFPYPTPEPLAFWMYGMQFPLDIIFIRDRTVLTIHANVPPPQNAFDLPATVNSNGYADAVLELNAGKAAEWGIKEGMEITENPDT